MQVRLFLHTALYVLAVSAVIASAIDPAGTARFLRRHTRQLAAAVRTVSDTTGGPVVTAAEIEPRPAATQTRVRDLRPGEYRVAIGTGLTARLRTAVDSGSARVNDQVDAVLTGGITQDGVELIPGGSVLHGAIVQVAPASKALPRGRVEIVFTVVQHAETRSRAAIRTRPLAFEADLPADTGRGSKGAKKQPIDVVLPAGHPIAASLAEPLVVAIPTGR